MEILKFDSICNAPYQKMYTTLFNAITDALEQMEKGNSTEAASLLKRAQQSTEDQYINAAEEKLRPPRRGPWTGDGPGDARTSGSG